MMHKVPQMDVGKTYVPPTLDEKCMAIAAAAASQFIFNILIFLIFISKSLSALEPGNPYLASYISTSPIANLNPFVPQNSN